jgi:hypothetical protein
MLSARLDGVPIGAMTQQQSRFFFNTRSLNRTRLLDFYMMTDIKHNIFQHNRSLATEYHLSDKAILILGYKPAFIRAERNERAKSGTSMFPIRQVEKTIYTT